MAIKKNKAIRSLKRKGFIEVKKGGHKSYVFYYNNRREKLITHVSHGSKNNIINHRLIKEMAGQLELNKEQCVALLDCPLKYEGYLAILIEKGIVEL